MAAEEKKPGNRFMMIGVVAVLVIAAGATFAFLKLQKSGSSSSSQHTQEAANVPTAQPSEAAAYGNSQPASPTANVPSVTAGAKPTPEIDARKTPGKAASDKTSGDKAAPPEKPAALETLGASGTSRISQRNPAQAAPEIAPSFSVVSGNTGAPLTNLARPTASSAPSAAAIEQSQLQPLQLIKQGTPVYPANAKARSITGMVVVQGTVGKDGKVSNLQFISGQPVFKNAAFDAVRQYLFKQAKLNGQPIEQTTQIRMILK
jgi:TonB family protein